MFRLGSYLSRPSFNRHRVAVKNGLELALLQITTLASDPVEKIRSGIWVHNGLFELIDAWIKESGSRKVFKFKLQVAGIDEEVRPAIAHMALEDDRLITSWVKLEVGKRDKGRCVDCGATAGLHFDHIIPYSKGGSSKDPAIIQILCARHNVAKHDKIE